MIGFGFHVHWLLCTWFIESHCMSKTEFVKWRLTESYCTSKQYKKWFNTNTIKSTVKSRCRSRLHGRCRRVLFRWKCRPRDGWCRSARFRFEYFRRSCRRQCPWWRRRRRCWLRVARTKRYPPPSSRHRPQLYLKKEKWWMCYKLSYKYLKD